MITITKLTADWCQHCKTAEADIQAALFSKKRPITYKHLDVDTEQGAAVLASWGIKSIPTFLIEDNTDGAKEIRIYNKQDTIKFIKAEA